MNTLNEIDILAFSPHPDDAEIGCGGTLLLSANRGLKTAIADLSNGECSTRGTAETRESEKQTASEQLGLTSRFCAGLPDTKIGREPGHLESVIHILRETTPRIVLAPYSKDRHPDHENAASLIRSACFYSGVASIGKGAPWRPEALYYYMIHSPFEPSWVVDISSVWKGKDKAIRSYRTQFLTPGREPPLTAIAAPDFMTYLEARAVYFGAMIGVKYGEPFFCRGPVPATGLPGLDSPRQDRNTPHRYKSVG